MESHDNYYKSKSALNSYTKTSNYVSSSIANYLLAGWILLDKYCPVCTTVLVKNKAKLIWCVYCESWATTKKTKYSDIPTCNNFVEIIDSNAVCDQILLKHQECGSTKDLFYPRFIALKVFFIISSL